ncbi:MAG: glycosyltransferase family 4 protein [bacterium]
MRKAGKDLSRSSEEKFSESVNKRTIKTTENRALNILVICNKSPWPAGEGGPIAMNNLIEGLIGAGHKVKVLALNTNKYHVDVDQIPADYRKKTGIQFAYIDLSVKLIPAFLNLFTQKSYHVQRFISRDFEKQLIDILKSESFDIVQIELLYMSPYVQTIRKHAEARVVLRAHNIEHLIWERLTASESNPVKRLYLNHLATTLKNYELKVIRDYDGIVPITKKDGAFFSAHTDTPVCPVSFGIDISQLEKADHKEPEHAAFHIGAMNWLPNEEGIRWLLEKVWPIVKEKEPDLPLYLAGRHMPSWIQGKPEQKLYVPGEVPDAYEFIKSKSISVAPLLSGSGIRIKIIESRAMGRAVISTTIGAEGINYIPGENMLIADSPEAFASAIVDLYRHPEKARKLGEKARQLVREQHATKQIIKRLVSFYREIL